MKRILITGANSYIGTSFEKYIKDNFANQYEVDTIDMIDGSWKKKSFAKYDSIFHVAGIAHQKETNKNAQLYYKVNRDLAIDVAKKAQNEGTKQFVFLSSMSVYGKDNGIITKETDPKPKTNYGKSKLEAEKEIIKLSNHNFKVCILRPPMVYGDGCKGNYQTIVRLIKRFPVFPRVINKRSLIHINNLVIFVKKVIDEQIDGLFVPQDENYVRTIDLAKKIAELEHKRVYFSLLLGLFVIFLMPFSCKVRKAFGNLIFKDV